MMIYDDLMIYVYVYHILLLMSSSPIFLYGLRQEQMNAVLCVGPVNALKACWAPPE